MGFRIEAAQVDTLSQAFDRSGDIHGYRKGRIHAEILGTKLRETREESPRVLKRL